MTAESLAVTAALTLSASAPVTGVSVEGPPVLSPVVWLGVAAALGVPLADAVGVPVDELGEGVGDSAKAKLPRRSQGWRTYIGRSGDGGKPGDTPRLPHLFHPERRA